MASASLQIKIESASNLYKSVGPVAGKCNPYVIVEVPGQESMKLQTEIINNEPNPLWNFTGEIDGFMDRDVLRFIVMGKDMFAKADNVLGKAELTAQDFYPNGFHGELTLADSKTQATLSVMVVVTGFQEAAPLELVEREGTQMSVPGRYVEGTTVAGSSSAAIYSTNAGGTILGGPSTFTYSGIHAGSFSAGGFVVSPPGPAALASGVAMHGSPMHAPCVLATTTTPSHSVACSTPRTYSAPRVLINGKVTTSIVGNQSMASQSMATQSIASQFTACQPVTYATPWAAVPCQSVAAICKVMVHPPVTVTAEEFARIVGTNVADPLPVTAGIETAGVETNREVFVNDTEAVDGTVKIKKKRRSKRTC